MLKFAQIYLILTFFKSTNLTNVLLRICIYTFSLTQHQQVAQATELLYESLNSMNTTCTERYVLNICFISIKGSKSS